MGINQQGHRLSTLRKQFLADEENKYKNLWYLSYGGPRT
jgi:hypothetical protein